MGVLHPVEPDGTGLDAASGEGNEDASASPDTDSQEARPTIRRRRYVPPSSVGFSFFVRGKVALRVTARAAIYCVRDRKQKGSKGGGQFSRTASARKELSERTVEWSVGNSVLRRALWDDRAAVDMRVRRHRDGLIVTLSLVNRRRLDRDRSSRESQRDRIEASLFEVELECEILEGELADYPRVESSLLTDEEQELELQYRDRRILAVGHGAAADWEEVKGRPRVRCDFMPAVEVPLVTVNDRRHRGTTALALKRLATEMDTDALTTFLDGYLGWIVEQEAESEGLEGARKEAASRLCRRMREALARMRSGVKMLRCDPIAAESFRLANRAMLDQMHQADLAKDRNRDRDSYRWRPFQLAFLLMVVESTAHEHDPWRDVLDLIWFPTGGGKTEAYLGLVAFLIAWRRKRYPASGAGTTVLMRYTLRLLTAQQFERASRLICALELIRRSNPRSLGSEPISIGMWVGDATTPNRFKDAAKIVAEIRAGSERAADRLLLRRCPWCSTRFKEQSYDTTHFRFHFRCVNESCDFGGDSRPLPCNVVDEALYEEPPSLLIATIDKFARLAWEERAATFFGHVGQEGRYRPPELIIQDELHLITGPLGSVAGLYEAGLETLLVRLGVRPKYIASTATIRMAREQVQRLYARDLAVFPPPGLSHEDSWFARTDDERPGRLYLGYLAPLLDQQSCFAPLAALLLAAPHVLFDADQDRNDLLEAWWTQVVYHGSLSGVANSHHAFHTDVRDVGRRIAAELGREREAGGVEDFEGRALSVTPRRARFRDANVTQLTSRRSASENRKTFAQLGWSREKDGCLDAVLATNMVSVGLDVDRLALMVINGQPFTTAEYIQASSRVGRAQVPGLVVVNTYRHQSRGVAHYENFRAYHESFYRFVEPGSLTPFTHQVRSRALHAALVTAIRHSCPAFRANKAARQFRRGESGVVATVEELKKRCARAASSNQATKIGEHIVCRVDEWEEQVNRCARRRRELWYSVPFSERKRVDGLLRSHEETKHQAGLPWPTLNSMRNVEGRGALWVRD